MKFSHLKRQTHKSWWYVATVILLIIGIVAYMVWDIQQVQRQSDRLLAAPSLRQGETNKGEHAQEGSDTTEVKPDALANYRVASDAPRLLTVSKLGIRARIQPMGVNGDTTIQAPVNINDAGWYTGSAKPGMDGAVFIDGHASGDTRFGLFGSLDRLSKGDTIDIEKGDHTILKYKVVHIEKVALKEVDMQKALTPYGGAKKGLTLMTCTGVWVKDSATLDHRFIVYAEQL